MQLLVAILLASEFFLIIGLLIKTLQTRSSASRSEKTHPPTKPKNNTATVPFHISHIECASVIVKNLSASLSKTSCLAERVEVMLATFDSNQIMNMVAKDNSRLLRGPEIKLQSGPLVVQKWASRNHPFVPRTVISDPLAKISIQCIKRQDLDELIDDYEIKCQVVVHKVKQSGGLPDPRFRFGLKPQRTNISLSIAVDESVVCLYEPYLLIATS